MDFATRLAMTMTLEEAKGILGIPSTVSPTTVDVEKAWRQKSLENHPDRGGSHEKMVEVNVAREVLEGKRTPSYQRPEPSWTPPPTPVPRREPPKPIEVSFMEAKQKAGVPTNATWIFITDSINAGYSSDEFSNRQTGQVLYGKTDSKHVFVGMEYMHRAEMFIGGAPSQSIWNMKVYMYPLTRPLSELAAMVISLAVKDFEYINGKRFNGKVWMVPDNLPFSEKVLHVHGKAIPLKMALVQLGELPEDDPSVAGRKKVIEFVFGGGDYQESYETRGMGFIVIDGKEFPLSKEDFVKFKRAHGLEAVIGRYYYGGERRLLTRIKNGKKVMLWLIRNAHSLPQSVKDILQAAADQMK